VKTFEIPVFYRSPVISKIKKLRKDTDPRKKDYTPSVLDFGPLRFFIARHFGFCYGVENAIEISYRAVEENPDKRIFLLSEMIHNPEVNNDLLNRGVKFIMDTSGRQIISWDELTPEDIIIIPAFGTTLEIQKKLAEKGLETLNYDATCPFVEKVWNRASTLGREDYTIIVHGKHRHEETRATFSHSKESAPTIVVRDLKEAELLGKVILGEVSTKTFYELFKDKFSEGFNPLTDLNRIGVVNQTTMLATETQQIADHLKDVMIKKFGEENLKAHYADTKDTLCYATNDNQRATYGLLEQKADFAIVVGGYNSSNTSHIVELCEEKLPTYFISSPDKIISRDLIRHFDLHSHTEKITENFIPEKPVTDIILTSGASCPDSVVDDVLQKITSFFENARTIEEVMLSFDTLL
jgi:4-hydroxy-3-methylbut-2-enyl diphosphate reductase